MTKYIPIKRVLKDSEYVSVNRVSRDSEYVPVKRVSRDSEYVSIYPKKLPENDPEEFKLIDINENIHFADKDHMPEWKGLYGGKTSIEFWYQTDKAQDLSIRIGNNSTGKAYINKRCYTGKQHHEEIILAQGSPIDIAAYDHSLWANVENAGDAIRHIAFMAESETPVFLSGFNLMINNKIIARADSDFFKPPLKITNTDVLYMDDFIKDYCLQQIFYCQNPFLRCAVNEFGSSWKWKYGKIYPPETGPDIGWYWDEDGKPQNWKQHEWCGSFQRWVLETADPQNFHDLPRNFLKQWFKDKQLYISPYAEINQIPYRGNIYPDFYRYLGELVKPGFLASTTVHITMFLSWCDINGKPGPFISDKNKGPNYFLGLGGNQNNRVTINKFSINYYDDGVSNIIWYRKNSTGKRICAEDNKNDEGFSDTRGISLPITSLW